MWNCHTLLEMNQTYGGGGQLTKVVVRVFSLYSHG